VGIRTIRADDWPRIVTLEAAAYAEHGLSEDPAVLASRARAAPDLCFVLDTGDEIAGYVLALPQPAFTCPDLARPSPDSAGSGYLHLHDLVVADRFRRQGRAMTLVRHLTSAALSQGYQRISLVAVAGSAPFWAARGYHPHPEVVIPAGYGRAALYMSQPIDDRTVADV